MTCWPRVPASRHTAESSPAADKPVPTSATCLPAANTASLAAAVVAAVPGAVHERALELAHLGRPRTTTRAPSRVLSSELATIGARTRRQGLCRWATPDRETPPVAGRTSRVRCASASDNQHTRSDRPTHAHILHVGRPEMLCRPAGADRTSHRWKTVRCGWGSVNGRRHEPPREPARRSAGAWRSAIWRD